MLKSLQILLHIALHTNPGHQFWSPGTNLIKRLSRSESGINLLNSTCKDHDVDYSSNHENLEARRKADSIL